jgi:hypothetical protein
MFTGEPMKAFLAHYQSFPATAKNGIILLIAAWLWLLISFYRYYTPGEVEPKLLVSGFITCTLIFKVRSWARILALLGNVISIVLNLFLAAHFLSSGPINLGIVAVINMVLFGAATVFLAVPETAKFYKAHTPVPSDGSEVYDDKPEKK